MTKKSLTPEEAGALLTLARRTVARGGFLLDCEEAMIMFAEQRDHLAGQLAMAKATALLRLEPLANEVAK